jgi:hydrogenase maturation protease
VLGLGNPLLADDGAGLVMLQRLQDSQVWPDDLQFVDGGTWGLSLLPLLEDVDRLLILDAVCTGEAPGTVVRGESDQVPRWYAHPVSPHQVDLREVLGAATLLDVVPATLVVIGIEPETTEGLHIGLSESVESSVDAAVAEAARVLRSWGVPGENATGLESAPD